MAADTIAAASAAPGVGLVLVVAEDAADGDRLAELPGVRIQLTTTTGLNEAIRDGLAGSGAAAGDPVAVLPGDLPSLTADELGAALAAARAHPHRGGGGPAGDRHHAARRDDTGPAAAALRQ